MRLRPRSQPSRFRLRLGHRSRPWPWPGRRVLLAVAAVLAVLAAPPLAAAEHQVQVRNNFYSPANLTIAVGDTVTWTNASGGLHNVHADDDSFRCADGCDGQGGNGNPATSWSFSLTFTDPGLVPYYCDAHGGPGGLGMSGSIDVVQASNEPGTVRFVSASYSAGEGSGNANVTVTRTGGDDGAVSVAFATGDGSAVAGADYQAVSGTLSWADGEDGVKGFSVPIVDDAEVEGVETVNLSLSNPGGGAALGSPSTATLNLGDNDQAPEDPGSLRFADAELSAGEGDGSAEVRVERVGASAGTVGAEVRTSDGSAVAGEDYTAVASTVSFGDGEAGAQSIQVPLLDDGAVEGNETVNLSLASPTGGVELGDPSAATVTILDDDLPAGPCQPDDTTLCLHDARFQVQVRFRDPNQPQLGLQEARKIDFTDRAGLFYFFNPANVEMLLKVQNACVEPFDRWWVFYAATTNVEFRVTVIDTQEGVVRSYDNPQGQAAAPVQDTQAFATCP